MNSTKQLRRINTHLSPPKKSEKEGTLSDSFYKAGITPISKQDNDTTRRLETNIPDEYRCKIFQYTSKSNLTAH